MVKFDVQDVIAELESGDPDLLLAAAALLYGQPFGFTRDMVRALRELPHPATSKESRDLAYQAIENLEALLPPED